ncbi:MAG: hypothetical protein WED10_09730 [Brumimicrobium sp.]
MKYILISLIIILVLPLLIALFYNTFTDGSLSVSNYYSNLTKGLIEDFSFLIALLIILLIGIWFIGGLTGRLIIDKNKPKFLIGALAFFSLWVLLFLSLTLLTAIENTFTWGLSGFESAVTGWIIYGLIMFLIFGIIHGLTMGYFYGNELNKIKKTTR